MKLSVCMIVRNEAARLEGAIGSVRAGGLDGEVVVCDTGSTDDTRGLAARLGARVTEFAWCDDFAAARNACQREARGEWVLWLDADERLKLGSGEAVRRAIADRHTVAYQVIREDFFSHDRTDWFSEMYQLRLVRRDLPVRFVGRIHEHLDPAPVELAAKMGKAVRVSGVRLQHWGYTNDRLPEKLHRAAVLCELELRDRPGQLYYLVELARSLLSINSPETRARGIEVLGQAAAAMLEKRRDAKAPSPMAASLIEQLLALPGQGWVGIDELLQLAERWFPRSAPLVWAAARTHSLRGDWALAERALRKLLHLLETSSHDRYMSFDPRVGEDALFNLGVCLVRQASLGEATEIFTKLLGSTRRAEDARKNLAAIAEIEGRFGG